ncbi:MAG: LytTR family DNA-binding domain-containing protein [Bacteroides sp.]|nr:LytTR family DNA-binding domain-containing protein [Roseburia sp.]MCM1347669.1 LytTR family DNA-binding domain-containing protein [Bacteroides sp.]MCM1421950.1 LytTR family DNA-binding domain-containing protein [Bacteroides sp.]
MIRCIAIDDEPMALSIICKYCERRGGVELETYTSPRAGMQRILEARPDIVFLDIEMNGTSGIELARRLPGGCALIFTTAFAQYAVDGFEVNAVDFLHKPYFYDRFHKAMDKAEQWLRMNDLLAISEAASRQLILKAEYKNVAVAIDNICYIESMDNYIRVHLADQTSVMSKMSLRSIEEMLPADEFIRVHRSYVVPKSRIVRFTRTEIVLNKNGKVIPVGRKYIDVIVSALKNE